MISLSKNIINSIPKISFKGLEQTNFQKTAPIPNDSFERTTQTTNEFILWAQETDFLNNGLNQSLSKENLIGKGFSHSVYSIPGNDDYVLRISNFMDDPSTCDYSKHILEDKENKGLKGNIGQEVALISSKSPFIPDVSVLKKQKGFSNGNPPASVLFNDFGNLRAGELEYEAIERKYHFAKSIDALSKMPQESFDKLIEQIEELDEMGYRFDYYNANNFLLDEENASINIIDTEKVKSPAHNDYGNILCALVNADYLQTFTSNYPNPVDMSLKFQTLMKMQEVIEKFSNSMKSHNKKYSTMSYEFITLLLPTMVMSSFLNASGNQEKISKLVEMGLMEQEL